MQLLKESINFHLLIQMVIFHGYFLCFEELLNATANDKFAIIKKLMEEYKLDIS